MEKGARKSFAQKVSVPSDPNLHLQALRVNVENSCEPSPPKSVRTSAFGTLASPSHHTEVSYFRQHPLRSADFYMNLKISTKTSRDRTRLLPTERAAY